MEQGLDLFEKQICGVHFWERVRFPLHRQILEQMGLSGQAHTSLERSSTNRLRSALRAAKNTFTRNPYLAPRADVCFFGSSRRKLHSDGKWWDIYCDPLIDALQRTNVCFEPAYLGTHLSPAKTPDLRYLDLLLYLAAVRRRLRRVRVFMSRKEVFLLQSIERQISKRFGMSIDLQQMVWRDLLSRKSLLPLVVQLLKRVRPKLVLLVCSYGKETFVEACNELGIPVVELQHGVIDRFHLGYSFPGSRATKRAFPDYLFLFGNYWRDAVDYPIPKDRVRSVGFPYLESELKKYTGIKKRGQVVFISQGTVGRELSKLAVDVSKRNDFPYVIVYKCHPGEYARWQRDYPWLAQSAVRVVASDTPPLYRLFAESNVQVGVNSTALFEGLAFGLGTLVVNLPGAEYMERIAQHGLADIVSSPEEVVDVIRQDRSWSQPDTSVLFEPNATQNALRAIDELLDGSRST